MTIIRIAARYFLRYKTYLLIFLMGFMLNISFELFRPLILKLLVDYAIIPGDIRHLYMIMGILAVGGAIALAAVLASDYALIRIGANIHRDLQLQTFAALHDASFAGNRRYRTEDAVSRFSEDLPVIERTIAVLLPVGIQGSITFAVSTAILFHLEWKVALVTLAGLTLLLIGPKTMGSRAEQANHEYKREKDRLIHVIQENVKARPVIQGFNLQHMMTEKFRKHIGALLSVNLRAKTRNAALRRIPMITLLVLNFTLLAWGSWLAFEGRISIGSFLAVNAIFWTMANSAYDVISVFPQWIDASISIRRIGELLGDGKETAGMSPNLPAPDQPFRELCFDHVSFGYEGGGEVLRHISMRIPSGASIALIGPSGSGKSTILQLIMRLIDPKQGAIRMNGRDIRQFDPVSWRERIGIVFQDTILLRGTIRDNIRIGNLAASDDEVEEAARMAGIHEFVAGLPDGYDTLVDEEGNRLSGGQRQRIGIARALLRDPEILLLDEATSALDAATEASIQQSVAALARQRTVITVTHRLSSIRHADHIYYIDQGNIAEHGAFAELLERNGAFKNLWDKQSGITVSLDSNTAAVESDRLSNIPVFAGLDAELLQEISRLFVTERYESGRTVVRQGEDGDQFYIVARGKVEVTRTSTDGETRRIAELQDGDHFGEIALVRNVPRTATVSTLTPCLLLSLRRVYFELLLSKYPQFRSSVMKSSEERLPDGDGRSISPYLE